MRKLYTSLLLVLVSLALSSCASGPAKNNTVSHDEPATLDAVEPTVSQTQDLEQDSKPEAKKSSSAGEEAVVQAIKRQNEGEITKAAHDLLMTNPSNLKALNALGLANYKKGKYKAAEFFLGKALKIHSDEAGLYNNLALVKLAQGEQREAVKLLKTGLTHKSNDIGILTNLGGIYTSQKDFVNAEVALEPVYKSGTKDVKALTNYATSLAATKKYPEATAVYKKLLADNANSREIMLNYSVHLVENVKDYKQGLDLISRLKFVGVPDEARNVIKDLENKAKAGLK